MEIQKKWDAIVIGSGMGGMACASALARYGKKVLVLEQHYVAGGMTHTFKRKQFLWDVGVHCLGEMEEGRGPFRLMKWLTRDGVRMNSLGETYDSFTFPGGDCFPLPAGKDKFEALLLSRFPTFGKGIREYLRLVQEAGKSAKQMFLTRHMPRLLDDLVGPFLRRRYGKFARMTTKQVLDDLFQGPDSEKIKAVLAGQWGYYGSPPSESSFFIHAVTVRHFWNGGHYPVGSSKVFAEHMLAPVKDAGGEVKLRASVASLIMDKGRVVGVTTDRGEEFFAPAIISAIGARATVGRLLSEKQGQAPWAKKIQALSQSPCHLCLYLGFEGDIRAAGATSANQWFFETWDMEDTDWDLSKKDSEAPVLYTSYPALKDPEHVYDPAGTHTGEIVTFVPWKAFSKWEATARGKRGADYDKFKKDLEERLFAQFAKHKPELARLVKYKELSTPLSTTFYCRSPQGAIYGLNATPERFTCREIRAKTPIKGLYMAGSDVGTLGVIGAMYGGVMAAAAIEGRVLKQL